MQGFKSDNLLKYDVSMNNKVYLQFRPKGFITKDSVPVLMGWPTVEDANDVLIQGGELQDNVVCVWHVKKITA